MLRFISDNWRVHHRIVRVQMLSKSLTGEEIASELISVLSTAYSIHRNHLIGAMRDRASTNGVAMQTLKVVYPFIVDIGCFSHTIDHVGDHFKTPHLTEFISLWINLFSHSPKTRLLWKSRTGRSMSSYSATRWWSKWEVIKQVMIYFGDVHPFLTENEDIGPALRPKLLIMLNDPQKNALIQLEMAAAVDWDEPFVKACCSLEGDGFLALDCYETIDQIVLSVSTEHIPNVRSIAEKLSGQPVMNSQHEVLVNYARNCVKPGLDYFTNQLKTNLSNSLEVFKTCRLFSPQKVRSMEPTALTLDQSLKFLPFLDETSVNSLKEELPCYLARVADISEHVNPLEWWKLNEANLPNWGKAVKQVALIQPSLAVAERVFLLLKSSFGDLQDYVEASLMLQFNDH